MLPRTAAAPWPMKALEQKTSRLAPVRYSPTLEASMPGTASSVPVYVAENWRIGAFAAFVERVSVMSRPPWLSSIVPLMGLPVQGA